MPTTYGNNIAYCLKSHCGVRGYCRQKWVLQVQIICKFSNERTCKRNKDVQGLSCGFEACTGESWLHQHSEVAVSHQHHTAFWRNTFLVYFKIYVINKTTAISIIVSVTEFVHMLLKIFLRETFYSRSNKSIFTISFP